MDDAEVQDRLAADKCANRNPRLRDAMKQAAAEERQGNENKNSENMEESM